MTSPDTSSPSSPVGRKRLEGRDEPVIDAALPIIDAHIHLFDRPLGRYMLEDYLDDAAAGHNIEAAVYVESQAFNRAGGSELLRPLGEVEFANGVAAMCASGTYGACQVAAAIVGHADLRHGEKIAELLDRCSEVARDRFRGVRQILLDHESEAPYRFMMIRPPRAIMQHPRFDAGFSQLAPRGLSFDAAIYDTQIAELAELADRFPDTTIILNHLGFIMALEKSGDERRALFKQWQSELRNLARRHNMLCKIGGLGMPPWGIGLDERHAPAGYRDIAERWRPYVETAIEAFGPERCMMESNFPPDSRSCGFVPLWNAMKFIVSGYSPDEKAALFHDTAVKTYRIGQA